MKLQPGTKAPDITLQDAEGNNSSLKQFAGKWVILYFYPKDNTSGCTREAIDFTALISSFTKKDAVVIGISPDSSKSHKSFIAKHDLKVILLSDPEHQVLESYGVWQKKSMYGKEYMGVVRTTFLIDPKGVIRQLWDKVKVDQHASTVYDTLCELKTA
jgi:thioredoxin-dependent peroxiredoxin